MKANMLLTIVMVLCSLLLSDCKNATINDKSQNESQEISNQELSEGNSVLAAEYKLDAKKVETEAFNTESLESNTKETQARVVNRIEVADKTVSVPENQEGITEPNAETVMSKESGGNSAIDNNRNRTTEPNINSRLASNPAIQEINLADLNRTKETLNQNTTVEKQIGEVVEDKKRVAPAVQGTFNHDKWNSILTANVSGSGKVDYPSIKSKVSELDEYLQLLSKNTPQSSWSDNKTKAYWINAYNAFTIKLIIDNYPVAKITDLHSGKPWDHKWIKLGDKTYSLNDIEHVILRPTYNDARIHFAVNCAAKSCPKVWNQAWTEENIEGALDKLTKAFITNENANQLSAKSVSVSKIFDWYKEDFGDLIAFLNKYANTKISSNAKVTFNDYDWRLNS